MLRRFVMWLKRLFTGSVDEGLARLPASEDAQETTKTEKIDVISCEVVSISFDDEQNDDEIMPKEIQDNYYDFEV